MDLYIWLEEVASWRIDKDGLVRVGSPDRLLIVGEAPGASMFGGRAGKRLVELLGFEDRDELLESCDAFNLLARRSWKKDTFRLEAAKRERATLFIEADRVLLLGRVQKAFDVPELLVGTKVDRVSSYLFTLGKGQFLGMAIPRPSGIDRWWNLKENRELAAKAFKPWGKFARTGKWS